MQGVSLPKPHVNTPGPAAAGAGARPISVHSNPRQSRLGGDRNGIGDHHTGSQTYNRGKVQARGRDSDGTIHISPTMLFGGGLLGCAAIMATCLTINYYLFKGASYHAIKKATEKGILGNDQNRQAAAAA